MTGFRVAYGGAQELYSITPDITCLGKVIGGGLPVAAYGGSRDIMQRVAPAGDMYQAGTLSGNPLAMAAGIATLEQVRRPGTYRRLENTARSLASGVREAAQQAGIPLQATSVGSMWGFFFAEKNVTDYSLARTSNTAAYARFFHEMLAQGVYLAPSQFETAFVSTQHGKQEISATLDAARSAFSRLTGLA